MATSRKSLKFSHDLRRKQSITKSEGKTQKPRVTKNKKYSKESTKSGRPPLESTKNPKEKAVKEKKEDEQRDELDDEVFTYKLPLVRGKSDTEIQPSLVLSDLQEEYDTNQNAHDPRRIVSADWELPNIHLWREKKSRKSGLLTTKVDLHEFLEINSPINITQTEESSCEEVQLSSQLKMVDSGDSLELTIDEERHRKSSSPILMITRCSDDNSDKEEKSIALPVRFSTSASPVFPESVKRPNPRFCLSHKSVTDDIEEMSLSSSGLSPCSTSTSMKSFGRHRSDDFSDDSCNECPKLLESIDLSGESSDLDSSQSVPVNKQLKIVTSLDKILQPPSSERRSSSPAPLSPLIGAQVAQHSRLSFVNFLRRCGLSAYLHYFHADMNLRMFRTLTEDRLLEHYHITETHVRQQLLIAVNRARHEDIDSDSELL